MVYLLKITTQKKVTSYLLNKKYIPCKQHTARRLLTLQKLYLATLRQFVIDKGYIIDIVFVELYDLSTGCIGYRIDQILDKQDLVLLVKLLSHQLVKVYNPRRKLTFRLKEVN